MRYIGETSAVKMVELVRVTKPASAVKFRDKLF